MKKLILIALVAVFTASYSQAQVITNTTFASPYQNIISSATEYLTTINTNYQFAPLLLWDEVNYQNQIDISDGIGVSYDIYQPAGCYGTINTNGVTKGGFTGSVEAGIRNIGIAGQVCSGQGGFGLNYNLFDVRAGLYIDGGYNAIDSKAFGEVGFRLLKKPTQNTFAGLGLALQFPDKGPAAYPLVSVFGGITF
jgi:hypothetical protein